MVNAQNTTSRSDTVDNSVLSARNVGVTFDMERGQSRVLDDVSVDIERGETLGVVGESGSGKSMFASALLDAVVRPGQLTGEITYRPGSGDGDGEEIDLLSLDSEKLRRVRWEEIAMVFQGAMSSFNPTMSLRDHFEETINVHGVDLEAGMERAHQLLSDLYLDPDRVLDSYPHELSGGMQQRALIALSLVLDPEVLVMDEPTAALDLLMQRSIISLLSELSEKYDLTLVFITHDLPLVAGLCDRLAVMYAFEFVEIGPSSEVIKHASHPYTRALLNSTPDLRTPRSQMRAIEGESPDPVNVPTGCSYHPRCPLADEQCEAEDPAFFGVGDAHAAACFHWEQAADAIPYTVSEELPAEERVSEEPHATPESDAVEGESVVSIENLNVHFESDAGLFGLFSDPELVRAVDGVSLEIAENDVVALIGESGCGKTTLGKTAIGLQRPTDGSVTYRNQDIWDARDRTGDIAVPYADIRRSLQIIHQDPGSALNPNNTVLKSLAAPMEIWEQDLSVEDRRARIYSMLERVGMTPAADYANRYPHQLSGGEQQRIALVRALLMNPDMILADEAVSALDVSLRVDMMDLLLELQEQFDTSFLFISHNLSNARYMAGYAGGRIGIMYLGELVEIGPADDILAHPKHPYTKVLKWATPDLDPDAADMSEPPVRTIDIPDPVDPPSGCRFHTRCPEAREVCTVETPTLTPEEGAQQAACFREYDDHDYWESPPLDDPEVDRSESVED